MLDIAGHTVEFVYKQNGEEITHKGVFIPGGAGFDSDDRNRYVNMYKDNINLMTSGSIYYNIKTNLLGERGYVNEIGFKKPSLNTAKIFSKKPLAIEFWHTLTWPTMSRELRYRSEQPL